MSEIDRSILIRAFNDHLFEFLDDILKLLPGNRSMMTAIRSFQTVITFNKSVIIKCWHKYVYKKYADVIEKGEITFFFEKDYNEDLTNADQSNKIMASIDRLRDPIKSMNSSDQAKTMKYLQNLKKLCCLYHQLC